MTKKIVSFLLIFALSVMVVGSFWAARQLAIWDSLFVLWEDPWFKLTLLDLYLGFALFIGFVMYKEKSIIKTLIFIFLIASLGNMISSLYLLIQLYRLKNIEELWEPKRDKWQLF